MTGIYIAVCRVYSLQQSQIKLQMNLQANFSSTLLLVLTADLLPTLLWYATDLPEEEKSVTICTSPATYC